MKRKARNLPPWPSNRLPLPIDLNFAAGSAGRILDDGYPVSVCDLKKCGQVARHPHLVDRQDGTRARSYGFSYAIRINIISGIDIDEDGICSTISDGVSRRNKRMACRDHLIIHSNAHRKEGQVKRSRATRYGTGIGCAGVSGELPFEGGNLWALRHPTRQYGLMGCFRFRLIENWFRDRNHNATAFG